MNRILLILREQLADAGVTDDRHLLDRFLTVRDESAFAELVRRYGPLVWGACRRRLANVQDAEDAFQATFLVLVRRAANLDNRSPIGPWLYKVATMTARNVLRGNRRRTVITGPMEHEIPAPSSSPAELMDLDAALLALPERDRAAVVLCHLQGLSRREAAERLGCAEGTLSARLSRALQKLRVRLGDELPAVLAIAAVAIPAGLASATTRAAIVYLASDLTAAGVSPAVARLTREGLRMFWMRKVTVVAALVLIGSLVAVGFMAPVEPIVVAADSPKEKPADSKPMEGSIPLTITGTVTDVDGKPIAGARVSVHGVGEMELNSLVADASAFTAANGTYKIEFQVRRSKSGKANDPVILATRILVEADGFVAYSENFQSLERIASPMAPGQWDFVLARGEVIAGHLDGPDLKEKIPLLVRGPSFTRQYFIEKGGKFRFWVPKGTYTLTAVVETDPLPFALLAPSYLFNELGRVIKQAATAEKVASGTENLVLKLRKP